MRIRRRGATRLASLLAVTAVVAAGHSAASPAARASGPGPRLSAAAGVDAVGQLVEVLVVDSSDGDGIRTSNVVTSDRSYVYVATGTYSYDGGRSLADAECSTAPNDPAFVPERYPSNRLDLLINGNAVAWEPIEPGSTPGACSEAHTYQVYLPVGGNGRPRFNIADGTSSGDNRGVVTVAIYSTDCGNLDSCTTPPPPPCDLAGDPAGCVPPPPPPPCDAVGDPTGCVPAPPCDPADPAGCIPPACDPTTDPTSCVPPLQCDPAGDVTACLPPPPPFPSLGRLPRASTQLVETFAVDSNDPDGTTTRQPLYGGRPYLFVVSGIYTDGATGATADAECSATASDPAWKADRFGTSPDRLDLSFSGTVDIAWQPRAGTTTDTCDPATHTYSRIIPWGASSFANLTVNDSSHADNNGSLVVSIYAIGAANGAAAPNPGVALPTDAALVDVLVVDSRSSTGAFTSSPLLNGTNYVITVTGTFAYAATSIPGARADAECSDAGPGTTMEPARYANSLLDLTVNGNDVTWASATGLPCDPTSTYRLSTTWTVNGHVLFRIKETGSAGYPDNAGPLTVSIFRMSDPAP